MSPELILETTAYTPNQLTARQEVQIALAVRSNVGKSSLINALANRKNLAMVSSTPGKTRSINFYRVRPHDFYLVDLPGYGYARASHSERDKWASLLERYLANCAGLKALALLLDCRLPPQPLDKKLASFAQEKGLPLLPVLTKADKCNQRERSSRQHEWQNLLGTRPVITSSNHHMGLDVLWEALLNIAGITEPHIATPEFSGQ
ncbi:MAG: YihA family ribosome biogenesis GTP-binding protein [Desulfovibrio sp.]|nr:YihA family ribosome biogenesis GTP-binding protein [Desulfovibrio sp.]